ncbi:MAG: hypothetical protein PVF27_09205 [Gemmatimonadales bacterium]|jgi:hypothetical protein
MCERTGAGGGRAAATLTLVALVGLGSASCDLWGPSGSGVIEVTLVSPHGPEGAAVFELAGGVGLSAVTSDAADSFYSDNGDLTRVVVMLRHPGTIAFRVRAEDIGELPTVTVLQVADGENRMRTGLSDYEVRFRRIEDFTSERQVRAP